MLVGLAACAGRARSGPGAADGADGAPSVRVTRLTCESLVDPLGIDTPRPRLGWVLESDERGQGQTAFQVVARDEAGGILWDSGRVASRQQSHLGWAGKALRSGQRVEWAVRVWDRDGRPSAYSAPGRFEMGLLAPDEWRGQWIAASGRLEALPTMPLPDKSSRWIWTADGDGGERAFRTRFTIPPGRRVKQARATFGARGPFVVHVNGREVARGEGGQGLAPVRLQDRLKEGANLVTIAASGGAAIGRMVIDFDEGAPLAVTTGAGWKASRERPTGWQGEAFDDRAWPAAREIAPPLWGSLKLEAQVPPAPYLRKAFTLRRPVRAARAYVAGLGYFELHVNGAKIGDHALDPGFTRYDRRILYVTHDVTAALRAGANSVGVILGNGFFNQHAQDVWDFHLAPWRATPRLLLQLRITYDDGSEELVVSDRGWQAASGAIRFDGIRNGEVYDARLERPGWTDPDGGGGGGTGWAPVEVVAPPGGVLSAQMHPPIKVSETLRAARITEPRPGVFVYDFGVNTAGWARLAATGPAGTQVTLRYGERLGADGTVDQAKIATLVQQGPFQTDVYVLRGQGTETWEPRFTYHGFQYVEVRGYPGRPGPDSVVARVAHTAFAQTGRFESSNELLNKIQRATLWSYRANFVGIPTDCPHREKNGWMGDAHLAAELAMFNFGNAAAYTKWVRDIGDEMRETGELPGIVPTGGWGYTWGNGPAWDSAYLLVPWTMYQYTGDRDLLAAHHERFKRYVDYVGTRNYLEQNPSGWLGDWVPARDRTPEAVTHAGFHHADARIVAESARLLGRADEAARYEAVAEGVRKAFLEKFYDAASGEVRPGTQTALACALYYGLVPEADRGRVLGRLVANIEAKGGHLDAGILGTKCLPWVLTDGGRADLFYRIATQRDFPSWGHWFEQGATSLWEDWKGEASLNHIFLGDISAWFYRALAGLNPDPQAPGFERVIIRPHLLGDLTWVRAETETVRGRLASAWRRGPEGLTLEVAVPVGSTAVVALPAGEADEVSADGARFLRAERDRRLYEIGSGTYRFVVRTR